MKRTLFLVVTTTLLVFTACDKDGIYSPKQKILSTTSHSVSTITCTDNPDLDATETSDQSSSWTWNKKLLSRIDYSDGTYLTFTYDGKQISQINTPDGCYKYIYVDKKIDKVEIYNGSTLNSTLQYQYRDKKVSVITTTTYVEIPTIGKKAELHQKALSFVLPSTIALATEQHIASLAKKSGSEAKESIPVSSTSTLSWEGDNLAKMVTTSPLTKMTIQFSSYDNKNNPYNSVFEGVSNGEYFGNGFSKNNFLTAKINLETFGAPQINLQLNYTYQYNNKDFPTSINISSDDKYSVSGYVVEETTATNSTITYMK